MRYEGAAFFPLRLHRSASERLVQIVYAYVLHRKTSPELLLLRGRMSEGIESDSDKLSVRQERSFGVLWCREKGYRGEAGCLLWQYAVSVRRKWASRAYRRKRGIRLPVYIE